MLSFPVISLEALEMVVSDHVPLVLKCRNVGTMPRRYKIETFWLKYGMPKHMVQSLWNSLECQPQASLIKFHNNTVLLHRALAMWHKDGFSNMDKQLVFCKKVILFFDAIEEKRTLAGYEFRMRCKIKERVFELANNVEEKWRQCSRCNWLKQGDRNTRFFHACAYSRIRKNLVISITHQNRQLTDPKRITMAFYENLKDHLGTSNRVRQFNPQALYNPDPNLGSLEDSFTIQEVEMAVKQLARSEATINANNERFP